MLDDNLSTVKLLLGGTLPTHSVVYCSAVSLRSLKHLLPPSPHRQSPNFNYFLRQQKDVF